MSATFAATLRTAEKLKKVALGRCGWISLTEEAQKTGLSKASLQALAERMGLETKNHGRHGLTAFRKEGA